MTAVLENGTETVTSHVLFIRSDTLERAIYNALLHTPKAKDYRVALECVRFEFDGSELTTIGTDSYRLCWETVELDPSMSNQNGAPFAFSLRIDAAKSVLTTLKAAKNQRVMLRYTEPVDAYGTIEFQMDSSKASYPSYEEGFPAWRSLTPSEATRVERDHIRFNVTHLTDLAKVKCGYKHPAIEIELHSSAINPARRGPAVVRFNSGPSILIMPLRGPED